MPEAQLFTNKFKHCFMHATLKCRMEVKFRKGDIPIEGAQTLGIALQSYRIYHFGLQENNCNITACLERSTKTCAFTGRNC